ncbi:hypothetical protein CSA80_01930 [Candidatus Saccharibacteria bacterium]|nr:MAG: hypothetical protein CSA80_01930 [Candidatus Saccharibacteria bacterium]
MHIVDLVIGVLLVGALLRGFQIGFIRQAFSTVAFIIGLFPGSWVASHAMSLVDGPSKPVAGLAILLTVCFLCMTVGELFAVRLKVAVRNPLAHRVDNTAGALMSLVTLLLGLWLAAAIFSLAASGGLQAQLRNSAVIGWLNARLPSPTTVLHSLNTLIDPNQSPQVFAGREPSPDANQTLPKTQAHADMLTQAKASVVKIEGLGCGGIVDGSGFVYAPEVVATNAHVIAGVSSPKVRLGTRTYNTTVVAFDPANDLAVLRVPELAARPLPLNRDKLAPGTDVFALGYPAGGDFRVSPAVLLDTFTALGQDIYGKKRVTRDVYSLQTTVVHGNSGGPVVATDGSVVAVVFATSTAYNNIGYALTTEQASDLLSTAQSKDSAVDTGKCSQ